MRRSSLGDVSTGTSRAAGSTDVGRGSVILAGAGECVVLFKWRQVGGRLRSTRPRKGRSAIVQAKRSQMPTEFFSGDKSRAV